MQRILETGCLFVSILSLVLVVACEDDENTDSTGGTGGLGSPAPPAPTNSGALYILPASVSVSTNAGNTAGFKAGGGTGPFAFALADGNLGSLGGETDNPDGSVSITYTTKAGSGANTVTVTDGAGATRQASISQSQ